MYSNPQLRPQIAIHARFCQNKHSQAQNKVLPFQGYQCCTSHVRPGNMVEFLFRASLSFALTGVKANLTRNLCEMIVICECMNSLFASF